MSNLFFYEYSFGKEKGVEIIASGLVGATDAIPAGAHKLTAIIEANLVEQGHTKTNIKFGRLINIKRV
jgi:hypothetical protein